jgi:hypothetical protein
MIKQNENAVTTGAALCAVMLISLFISSFLISYFAMEMYGYKLDSVSLPANIEDTTHYNNNQDFKNNPNTYTTTFNSTKVSFGGGWTNVPGIGMVLTSIPAGGDTYISENYIIKGADGIVTNQYIINNSVHAKYEIILKRGYGRGVIALLAGTTSNMLVIDSDGFRVPRSFVALNPETWQGGDIAFIPYPGANQVDHAVITTNYNVDTYALDFTFNGQNFNMPLLNGFTNIEVYLDPIYGGVLCNTVGFALENYNTNNEVVNNIYDTTNESASTLQSFGALISTMIKVVGWGLPPSIMPIQLQILLIRTQEAVLIIGIIAFVRGI